MKDLYNIPKDNQIDYRLRKFVEYQHEVPSIHYRFLGEFIIENELSKDDIIWLAWLISVTYNEITCVYLYKLIKDKMNFDYEKYWKQEKERTIFGSAKLWVKRKDLFAPLMNEFNQKTKGRYWDWFISHIAGTPTETYRNIYNDIVSIKQSSRLGADFFLELIVHLKDYLGIEIEEPFTIDWKKCANLTSGILNIFYEDEKANEFDRSGKIYDEDFLYRGLKTIQQEIQKTYPEQNAEVPQFIGKICSFRNLFKGARYAGYHHDRQLEWIRDYQKLYPQHKAIWKECYFIRKTIFPMRFLGEWGGWTGIRKERKKLWLKYGLTGAETV